MPQSSTVEIHILAGSPEAKVEIESDDVVWVTIGNELLKVERLSEIVAFVEQHGQVTVKCDD